MEQRLIDANALIKEICSDCALLLGNTCDGERTSCYPSSIVRKQPTVDAVPVVRCKDCVNWDEEYSSGRKSLGNYRCVCHEWSNEEDGFYRYTAEDDYCSCGERRSDGK